MWQENGWLPFKYDQFLENGEGDGAGNLDEMQVYHVTLGIVDSSPLPTFSFSLPAFHP